MHVPDDPKVNWFSRRVCSLIPNRDYRADGSEERALNEQLSEHPMGEAFTLPKNRLWIKPKASRTSEATESMCGWFGRDDFHACVEVDRERMTEAFQPSNTLRISGKWRANVNDPWQYDVLLCVSVAL